MWPTKERTRKARDKVYPEDRVQLTVISSDDQVREAEPHDDTVEPDPLEDPEDVEAELDRYRWSKWKSAD